MQWLSEGRKSHYTERADEKTVRGGLGEPGTYDVAPEEPEEILLVSVPFLDVKEVS